MHKHDQNFSADMLYKIEDFIANQEAILANPQEYSEIINEVKLEALLVTDNSPYPQVRAVVSIDDDPDMPSLTFRTWVIGTVLMGGAAAVNGLFENREPPISLGAITLQILACECSIRRQHG